jgi:hypothetical protein
MLIFRKNLTIYIIFLIINIGNLYKGGNENGAYKSWPSRAVRRCGVFLCIVVGAVVEGKAVTGKGI